MDTLRMEIWIHSHYETKKPIGFDIFSFDGHIPIWFINWITTTEIRQDSEVIEMFQDVPAETPTIVTIRYWDEGDRILDPWFEVIQVFPMMIDN